MKEITPVATEVVPFSLKDSPSFIEDQLPVGRLSAEAYKERKAVQGQLLTTLGSYWKGRKPLILVRAAIVGCLLPATSNPIADLEIFLLIMGMADAGLDARLKSLNPKVINADWSKYHQLVDASAGVRWRSEITIDERQRLVGEWLMSLPYDKRIGYCLRPEECTEKLPVHLWKRINDHLGTKAHTLPQLIDQLGVMRFGRQPKVADTFSGGGSIPFEAARIGCEAFASDLNPIACMLTWGTKNIIGAEKADRDEISASQKRVVSKVNAEISRLGIEHDANGHRAKAYLYCIEARCPKTGWMVPLTTTWVVSATKKIFARLEAVPTEKRYAISLVEGASDAEMIEAAKGTLRKGRLVHPANPDKEGVSLDVVRGDFRDPSGRVKNKLRLWDKGDFAPKENDIFQERLYGIQWLNGEDLRSGRGNPRTFFTAVRSEDELREQKVREFVAQSFSDWQEKGLIPDDVIISGAETARLTRERGWTHWHHLFHPRQLIFFAVLRNAINSETGIGNLATFIGLIKATDWGNRCCYYGTGAARESISHLFYNQTFNTFFNYGVRGSYGLSDHIMLDFSEAVHVAGTMSVKNSSALGFSDEADIFITDPPYADAVNYHEITEFLIAWGRRDPPPPFDEWLWNSQRSDAIKGSDEKFRADMVAAYRTMGDHMPDNGIQVVMFTHQDPSVWADLGAIMWAAGMRVTAAWNVVTEVEKPSGEGNYVQGTILLVLRKRIKSTNGRRMNIEGEIEEEVKNQLNRLHDLDEDWTSERLYTDGDLQLAAYAAALRVVTAYETIDRRDVGSDVFRKLEKGERSLIRDLIDYAASVANSLLVPDQFPQNLWRELDATSRFYIRMLAMESSGATKFADYSDFARTFSVDEYTDLMGSTQANKASLAGANDLKGRVLGGKGFGSSPLRRTLFAVFKCIQKNDPKDGLAFLKTEYGSDYWSVRSKLIEFARYVALKTKETRPAESEAADLVAQKLEVDRI